MEIEVLKEDSEGFEVKILGEDHTFLGLITKFLNENKNVTYAAYKVEHPLVGDPKLFFKIKGIKKSVDIPVKNVPGVGPKTAKQLAGAGVETADQLLLHSPDKLAEKTKLKSKSLAKYIEEARKLVPVDRFGYRAELKKTLSEVSKALTNIKKSV
jgi:DNA-directed RNA polymerase subunit L